MFDIELNREPDITTLCLRGKLDGLADTDHLVEAFALVPPSDHLVVDLSAVEALDAIGALTLRDILASRSVIAETIVVSPSDAVSMQLVLHDVDRTSPIVRSIEEARHILDRPWAGRRHTR